MPKIKRQKSDKIARPCTNCFEPRYLKFNYTYVKFKEKKVEERYQAQILRRMIELSSETYMVISSRAKECGFERESKSKLGIKSQIPKEFLERFPDDARKEKLDIIRLYKNNNPILGRIIGIIRNNIFYVFYIDIGGKLYSH